MKVKEIKNLVKYYHENKMAHAYLIETNDIEKCLSDLLIVIKQIFCQDEFKEDCNKCNICNLINQNYLPSLIIISPDGMNIKKDQIIELKKKFSTVPVYTKENIYVIKNAEKLNGASANTMLKFLEDPEPNILGFFITDNANNVISTIRSRCEIIKFIYDSDELNINSIKNEYNDKYLVAIDYIYGLEVEKSKGILYNRDVILCKFKERDSIKLIFKIILIIYEELLKKVIGLENNFDFLKIDKLDVLTKDDVLKRINLIVMLI